MAAAYLDHEPPLAIAHRGGSLDGAENSLAAFRRAFERGYRYLETDVHATADGELVAFHDDTLDRVTDRQGAIADLRWAEVQRARIGGREPVPLLRDLLRALPGARFSIDAKTDAAVEPLVRVLHEEGALARVCVGSFDQRRLWRLRRGLPGVATSTGPWEVRALVLAARRLLPRWAFPAPAAVAAVPEWQEDTRIVDRRFVDVAHAKGVQVHVWTVNDPVDMHRLLDLGVDGIVTDDIETLGRVLDERGSWRSPTVPQEKPAADERPAGDENPSQSSR